MNPMQQLPSYLADGVASVAVAAAGPATPTAFTPIGATNSVTARSLPVASSSGASAAFVAHSTPASRASSDLVSPSTPASPARGASPTVAAELVASSTTSSSYHTLATSSNTTASCHSLAGPSTPGGSSASALPPGPVGSCACSSRFPLTSVVAPVQKVSFLSGEMSSVSQ